MAFPNQGPWPDVPMGPPAHEHPPRPFVSPFGDEPGGYSEHETKSKNNGGGNNNNNNNNKKGDKGDKKGNDGHVEVQYEGYTLERADAPVGGKPTWARVGKRALPFDDAKLAAMVKANRHRTRTGSTHDFGALSSNQQGVIDRLIAERRSDEKNKHANWVLIDVQRFGKQHWTYLDVKKLQVILKRVDRRTTTSLVGGNAAMRAKKSYQFGEIIDLAEPVKKKKDGGGGGGGGKKAGKDKGLDDLDLLEDPLGANFTQMPLPPHHQQQHHMDPFPPQQYAEPPQHFPGPPQHYQEPPQHYADPYQQQQQHPQQHPQQHMDPFAQQMRPPSPPPPPPHPQALPPQPPHYGPPPMNHPDPAFQPPHPFPEPHPFQPHPNVAPPGEFNLPPAPHLPHPDELPSARVLSRENSRHRRSHSYHANREGDRRLRKMERQMDDLHQMVENWHLSGGGGGGGDGIDDDGLGQDRNDTDSDYYSPAPSVVFSLPPSPASYSPPSSPHSAYSDAPLHHNHHHHRHHHRSTKTSPSRHVILPPAAAAAVAAVPIRRPRHHSQHRHNHHHNTGNDHHLHSRHRHNPSRVLIDDYPPTTADITSGGHHSYSLPARAPTPPALLSRSRHLSDYAVLDGAAERRHPSRRERRGSVYEVTGGRRRGYEGGGYHY